MRSFEENIQNIYPLIGSRALNTMVEQFLGTVSCKSAKANFDYHIDNAVVLLMLTLGDAYLHN